MTAGDERIDDYWTTTTNGVQWRGWAVTRFCVASISEHVREHCKLVWNPLLKSERFFPVSCLQCTH